MEVMSSMASAAASGGDDESPVAAARVEPQMLLLATLLPETKKDSRSSPPATSAAPPVFHNTNWLAAAASSAASQGGEKRKIQDGYGDKIVHGKAGTSQPWFRGQWWRASEEEDEELELEIEEEQDVRAHLRRCTQLLREMQAENGSLSEALQCERRRHAATLRDADLMRRELVDLRKVNDVLSREGELEQQRAAKELHAAHLALVSIVPELERRLSAKDVALQEANLRLHSLGVTPSSPRPLSPSGCYGAHSQAQPCSVPAHADGDCGRADLSDKRIDESSFFEAAKSPEAIRYISGEEEASDRSRRAATPGPRPAVAG